MISHIYTGFDSVNRNHSFSVADAAGQSISAEVT